MVYSPGFCIATPKSIRWSSNMNTFHISSLCNHRDGSGVAVPRPPVSDWVHKDDGQPGASEAERLGERPQFAASLHVSEAKEHRRWVFQQDVTRCSDWTAGVFSGIFHQTTHCLHDLKVPLPWKTPLSLASPDSTTAPMARSPSPLPSASCPRTPPSPPPLEHRPICSTVTQVAWSVVRCGEHPLPVTGDVSQRLLWTHPGTLLRG